MSVQYTSYYVQLNFLSKCTDYAVESSQNIRICQLLSSALSPLSVCRDVLVFQDKEDHQGKKEILVMA